MAKMYITKKMVDDFKAENLTIYKSGKPVTVGGGFYDFFTDWDTVEVRAVAPTTIISMTLVNLISPFDKTPFTITQAGKKAELDYFPEGKSESYNIERVLKGLEPPEPPKNYKLPLTVYNTYKALGISIYVKDVIAVADTVINAGDKVEFVSTGERVFISLKGLNSKTGLTDDFVISDDKKRALLSSFPTVGEGFTYTFTHEVKIPPPINYLVEQPLLDRLTADSLEMYVNDNLVKLGDDIVSGSEVLFKVTNEQIITSFKGYDNILGITNFFVISQDEKSAYLDKFPQTSPKSYFFEYQLKPFVPTKIQGANDIYAVADADVRPLIIKKYTYYEQNPNGSFVYTDFGAFILGFIKLPFKVDASLIGFKDEIKLGDKSTGVFADSLTVDAFTYDMGSISVPNSRGDFLDFKNTTALLHLPYCESVVIDVDYVIGETLRVEYVVNAYDGVALINIYSSKIDGIVLSKNVDMGIKIPFASVETVTPSRNSPFDISMGGDNGILKPFIELLRNDAILPDGFFTVPIVDESLISEQKGFIKVDEITLLSRANDNEISGIESLLSKGVFIK